MQNNYQILLKKTQQKQTLISTIIFILKLLPFLHSIYQSGTRKDLQELGP